MHHGWFTKLLMRTSKLLWTGGQPHSESDLVRILRRLTAIGVHLPKINIYKNHPSSNIYPFSFSPIELSGAIQSTRATFYINSSQRGGIREYRNLRKASSLAIPEDVNVLKKYYLAFNRIFFMGALKNLCDIQLHPPNSFMNGECYTYITLDSEHIPPNSASMIRLYNRSQKPGYEDQEYRLKCYLGTLLHEMLHAFLAIFSCRCTTFDCKSLFSDHVGCYGHLTAWQDAAHAIENATEVLLGERLCLSRMPSLASDWAMSHEMPAKNETCVGRWGMNYDEVYLIGLMIRANRLANPYMEHSQTDVGTLAPQVEDAECIEDAHEHLGKDFMVTEKWLELK
ncbi:hypothetical protein BGZ60DRAFT_428098 [Tricladium varicosporioides]|nr:hypothetical protein BGZ60DRAFT_428098 [Hymenoscyphus varicosporioides]